MNYQIFKTKLKTVDIFFLVVSLMSAIIFGIKIFKLQVQGQNPFLLYILLLVILFSLIFLAYFDFQYMEVHNLTSLILLLSLTFINLVIFFTVKEITLTNNWVYIPYDNMIGSLLLGSISQLLVIATKEKALGQGDVRVLLIIGLLIGYRKLVPWLYITVFSALIYGLILAYREKKLKNLKIPLVPFAVLGAISIILTNL